MSVSSTNVDMENGMRMYKFVNKLDKYYNWKKAISYQRAFHKLRLFEGYDNDFMTDVASTRNSARNSLAGTPRSPAKQSSSPGVSAISSAYAEEIDRLLKENEALKRRQAKHNLSMVVSLFKGRVRTKLQKAFDMWSEQTRVLNKDKLMKHQLLQLEVGLQHIESETSNKQQLQCNSIRLQSLLLMTLYFFKWKSSASLILLKEQKEISDKQNRLIMNEVRNLKDQLMAINQQENTLFQVAIGRGNDAINALMNEKVRLSQANAFF